MARRARPGRDRDRDVLARRARGALRRAAHGGHPDRGLPHARRVAHREGRARSPTPSGWCSGATRRSTRRATRARELWFMHHLFKRVRGALRRLDARARLADRQPRRGTTPSTVRTPSPTPRTVLREINGYDVATGEPVPGFAELKADGVDRLRLLDLLRRASPTASTRPAGATRATSTTPRAAGSRPSGAGRGRPTAACSTTARRADPRGQAVVGAQEVRLVGRGAGQVDRLRRPRLPGRQAARLPRADDDARGHGRDLAATTRSS